MQNSVYIMLYLNFLRCKDAMSKHLYLFLNAICLWFDNTDWWHSLFIKRRDEMNVRILLLEAYYLNVIGTLFVSTTWVLWVSFRCHKTIMNFVEQKSKMAESPFIIYFFQWRLSYQRLFFLLSLHYHSASGWSICGT